MKRLLLCATILVLSTAVNASQKSATNIALHASVSADSQEELIAAAVDGNAKSYWQSGSSVGDHWLEVDLQQSYTIDRVVMPNITGVDSLVVEVQTGDRWKIVYSGKQDLQDNPLVGFEPETTRRVRISSIDGKQMRVYEVQIFQYDPQPVFVNQSGYSLNWPKRFTAPLAVNGTRFTITMSGQTKVLYESTITDNIGDFTDFQPEDNSGPYVIHVMEKEKGTSVPFEIGPNLIQKVSYQPAINFMIDTRCWFGNSRKFNPAEESAGCPNLGVAWRDSHQMSFEIQSLLNMYFANPAAFSVDRMPVQGTYLGLREELPDETPEIVRLIYWAVDIYLRGKVNHTLLKEQLAYFVYAWPWLSEYIPRNVYEEARDYIYAIWDDEEINRWRWHDIEHTGDLFQSYKIIGTGKGQFPPGHSIIPNLMMYEVAKREGREDAHRYFKAAYDQTKWLIENLNWQDPRTTKGQRQGEYVTITSFEYFLQNYPEKSPEALREKIISWIDVVIERSDNMWDFRRYSDERWIIPSIRPETDPRSDSETGFNEVGNIAGFPAPAFAAASVVNDLERKNRLKELAMAHFDHVFGRNPAGRHFGFDAPLNFEGVELGWFQEYQGGAGILQTSRGVLDGSPKETLFPYNPYTGDPGHTEGWVTFNTPFNIALAYLSADVTSVTVYDASFSKQIDSIKRGGKIGIEITAPLNFKYDKRESAEAFIYVDDQKQRVPLQEVSISSKRFRGTFTIPEDIQEESVSVAYGYGWHEKEKTIKVR